MDRRKYTDKDLYGETGHPQASDIQQGQLGDCYLMASMGSMAFHQPALVESSIRYDAARESFRVSLYEAQRGFLGLKKEPKSVEIEVTQDDLALNRAKNGRIAAPGISSTAPEWPTVIETAYAKQRVRPGETLDDGFEHIGNGGWPKDALFALTGAAPDQVSASRAKRRDPSETFNQLKEDLDAHRPVVLSTNSVVLKEEDGLVSSDGGAGHAYMVEGTRKDGDQIKLTVRNPWGHNMDPTHGIHSMDPTVEVDLKTITENGHLQMLDRGPALRTGKADLLDETRLPKNAPPSAQTGDPTMDALLNSLYDPRATSIALRNLAASEDGQQFRASGQKQYMEQQREQENIQQMGTQAENAPVRSAPVMRH